MRNRTSFRVAFCGVLAALMVVIMLLGTMIPATEYLCPALAGVLSIPVVWEFGGKTSGLLYAAVALLSLILAPNKEAALFFVLLFGWYPLARPKLQHLKAKALRVVLKLVLFNAPWQRSLPCCSSSSSPRRWCPRQRTGRVWRWPPCWCWATRRSSSTMCSWPGSATGTSTVCAQNSSPTIFPDQRDREV